MAGIVRLGGSVLTMVRLELEGGSRNISNINNKNTQSKENHSAKNTSLPLLSLSKPSWIVTTQSNVLKQVRRRPDPPCVVCKGTGRVDCHHCSGTGRTNHVHLAMLPKGEWPKWCKRCGGSGLNYCSRCLGTGEYRYIMGFKFMEIDSSQDQQEHQNLGDPGPYSAADRLLMDDV